MAVLSTGTPEPQTTQDAPWLHGPSLNSYVLESRVLYSADDQIYAY
jgi:hypothetical protein